MPVLNTPPLTTMDSDDEFMSGLSSQDDDDDFGGAQESDDGSLGDGTSPFRRVKLIKLTRPTRHQILTTRKSRMLASLKTKISSPQKSPTRSTTKSSPQRTYNYIKTSKSTKSPLSSASRRRLLLYSYATSDGTKSDWSKHTWKNPMSF